MSRLALDLRGAPMKGTTGPAETPLATRGKDPLTGPTQTPNPGIDPTTGVDTDLVYFSLFFIFNYVFNFVIKFFKFKSV
jgi:hypothetical protein